MGRCLTFTGDRVWGENTIIKSQTVPGMRHTNEEERAHHSRKAAMEMRDMPALIHHDTRRARRSTDQTTQRVHFLWAVSTSPQGIDPSQARTFRRRTAWCWDLPVPKPAPTGEVYPQLFIDGLHLTGGWVLLIARSCSHMVAWQWAASENAAAYTALLHDLAPPLMVTTDGAGRS